MLDHGGSAVLLVFSLGPSKLLQMCKAIRFSKAEYCKIVGYLVCSRLPLGF